MADDKLKKRISALEKDLAEAQAREKTVSDLLEKKLNEIYTHYHISRTIGSLLDLQEMLRQVMGIIRKSLPFDRVSVYLLNEESKQLELAFYGGLNIAGRVVLNVGDGVPGRIVETGEHIHIHDLSIFYDTFNDFIHFPCEEKQEGSFIGISLKVRNNTIGAIGMDNPARYGLSVDDMDFMAILSHQIAAGIEKSLLFDRIEQLSQRDGLTGLYNHRMFQERLSGEISRRDRTHKALSLMMLDIDNFKQYNDDFGHQAGDRVLKQLATVISAQCRCTSIDVCCRYGGEEFAIIMPELELHNAVKAAERLRRAVEEAIFHVSDQRPEGRVTVSIGVASIADTDDISPEELLRKADEALYLSKRSGKNRVSYCPQGQS